MPNEQLNSTGSPPEGHNISEFESTLRWRAERAGLSIAELRAQDWAALGTPKAIDCLDPFEIEEYFSGALSEERLAHVDTCSNCSALLDVAKPRVKWFEEFLRSAAAQSAMKQNAILQRQRLWKPVFDASLIEATVVFGVSVFSILGWWYASRNNDILTSKLITDSVLRSSIVILGCGLGFLLVASMGAKWLSSSHLYFRTFGGPVLGGMFACFVCIFVARVGYGIAKNDDALRSAQFMLFQRIAFAQDSGQLYADTLYRQKLPSLPGSLVAEWDHQAFNISWEKPAGYFRSARSNVIATVYEGEFKTEKGGNTILQIGDKEIDVPAASFEARFHFGKDSKALVLVPVDSDEAAAVIPIAASADDNFK